MILEKNGKRKEVYTGFSWGVFFLGCLCPLFRGDFVGFIIQFIGLTLFSAITAPFVCFGGLVVLDLFVLQLQLYLQKKTY